MATNAKAFITPSEHDRTVHKKLRVHSAHQQKHTAELQVAHSNLKSIEQPPHPSNNVYFCLPSTVVDPLSLAVSS